MTLGKPARTLLAWLARQGRPVTQEELEKAPCFEASRKRKLVADGLILAERWGATYAYSITDAGRAALETDRMELGSDRRAKIALAVSIAALVVSVLALLRSCGVTFAGLQ